MNNGTILTLAWAMPNRWTFQIPPILQFVGRWLAGCKIIVDPFCGQSLIGTHRNDLAAGGMDAADYCLSLLPSLENKADAVLFDPPYSPRQISECYKSIGRKATTADTQNSALYSHVHEPLSRLLKTGGIALSFGWQSSGFGTSWETMEILLVRHGGSRNDTICVAQRKPLEPFFDAKESEAGR